MTTPLSATELEAARLTAAREAAARALAEADARRVATERPSTQTEIGGRGGREPTRYGDWERRGLAVDF